MITSNDNINDNVLKIDVELGEDLLAHERSYVCFMLVTRYNSQQTKCNG
jgi:hypothetical protein